MLDSKQITLNKCFAPGRTASRATSIFPLVLGPLLLFSFSTVAFAESRTCYTVADHWHTRAGDSNWDSKFDLTGPDFGDPDDYVDVWDLMLFADNWHEGQKP